MPSRAASVDITMRTLITLERILGTERVEQLQTQLTCTCSIAQKMELLTVVFGYSYEEAEQLTADQVDEELTIFFTRWLAKSIEGRLRSVSSQPSNAVSAATSNTTATPSTSIHTSRKTRRTK